MKGVLKNAVLGIALVSMLGACSTMTTVAERDTYAEPNWYAKCKPVSYTHLTLPTILRV